MEDSPPGELQSTICQLVLCINIQEPYLYLYSAHPSMSSIPFSCFEYSMETNKWQSYFLLLPQYTPLSPDIIRCNEKYGGQLPSVSCNAATARMPAEAKDITYYTGTGEGVIGHKLKLPINYTNQGSYNLFASA